ncbi:MAG: hypothetical protein JXA57_07170 [Armatimonadetes bacterium]|nr:hypothetical protein [Armatimonadota bacterium]
MRRTGTRRFWQPVVSALMLVGGATLLRASAPSLEVPELRRKAVSFAGGPHALAKVETLAFDFVVEVRDGPARRFHHAYDAEKRLYRYEARVSDFAAVPVWDETADDRWQPAPNPPVGEELVAVYEFPTLLGTVYVDGKRLPEPENTRILRRVHSRVMNERAWMFLPLFMGSETMHTEPVDAISDPQGGILRGFRGWWGEQPGESDVWTLYLDESGRVVRTDFSLHHNLGETTPVYWDDWQWQGPVRIAHTRTMPESNRRLVFENVRVNQPVDVSPRD